MRLIDADALAAHMFHGYSAEVTPVDIDAETYKLGWNDAIDAIMENAPTIEPEQGWIPVSETVDVPEHEVLACDKYGTELIGFLAGADGRYECESDECIMYDVVAWMPLPEAYKGETDGKDD